MGQSVSEVPGIRTLCARVTRRHSVGDDVRGGVCARFDWSECCVSSASAQMQARVLHLADEELPSNGCGDSRRLGAWVGRWDALEVGAIRIVRAPRLAPTGSATSPPTMMRW